MQTLCSCHRRRCETPTLTHQALVAHDALALLRARQRAAQEQRTLAERLHQDRLVCLDQWQQRFLLSQEQQRALSISLSRGGVPLQMQLAQHERISRFLASRRQGEQTWLRKHIQQLDADQPPLHAAIQVQEALLVHLGQVIDPTPGCVSSLLCVLDCFLHGMQQELQRQETALQQVQAEIEALNTAYQQEAHRLHQVAQETLLTMSGQAADSAMLLRWGLYVTTGWGPRVSLREGRLQQHLTQSTLEFQQFEAQQRHFWEYSHQSWPLHARALEHVVQVEALRGQVGRWQRERTRLANASPASSAPPAYLPLFP